MILFCFSAAFYAQSRLLVRPSDLRLVPETGTAFDDVTGYHLYVRKLPDVESIMLVETTKDPAGKEDNYAYRATEFNEINGNEVRYLNGKVLESEYSKFSLIDSSPEPDEQFGQAFHIYIPYQMVYGYPWSRNGTVTIGRGTFINIRSFEKKYGDYSGEYYDNAYMFDLGTPVVIHKEKTTPIEVPEEIPEPEQQPVPVLTDDYNPVASEKFGEISEFLTYSKGPETIVDDIMSALEAINPKRKADVVFAIDATGSMKDDIEQLRQEWVPRLITGLKEFDEIRLGLLLYRDYGDNFKFKGLPVKFFDFTYDIDEFEANLNGFVIKGTEGGDIPEAVYEAMYASMEFYKWQPDAVKKIILIGDAEPHPRPRASGKYSKDLILKMAAEKDISIDAIITPDDKGKRGR
ncbi:MAG: vWA domain-containing protein [Treponema sp.]|nr:vWA domain-containing protein [Treponema sp.]